MKMGFSSIRAFTRSTISGLTTPEAVFHPLAIGEGNDRCSFPADPQGMIDHHGRVRIKGKDRAEVGFAGLHQPEPLVFHGLKGPFMGTDRPELKSSRRKAQ